MVVQPDGKIVIVGTARQDNEMRAALVRYDAGGGLDGGFGSGGIKVLPALADGVLTVGRAVLASDGDIVFTGTVRDGATVKVFVARIGGDGTPDAGFGTGGVQRYLVGDGSCATATRTLRAAGRHVRRVRHRLRTEGTRLHPRDSAPTARG